MRASYPILCLMAVSGVAGFFGGDTKVRATDPDPCTRYECKVVHAYWDANGASDFVYAFYEVKDYTKTTNSYVEHIFTQSATDQLPRILSGKRDRLLFPQCEPSCGRSLNVNKVLAWQSPQEVVRLGKGWEPADATNDRGICTATSDGKGVPSKDQSNPNDLEKSPPLSQSTDG